MNANFAGTILKMSLWTHTTWLMTTLCGARRGGGYKGKRVVQCTVRGSGSIRRRRITNSGETCGGRNRRER